VIPLTGSKAKLRNEAACSLSRVEISLLRLAVFFETAIFCFFLTGCTLRRLFRVIRLLDQISFCASCWPQ